MRCRLVAFSSSRSSSRSTSDRPMHAYFDDEYATTPAIGTMPAATATTCEPASEAKSRPLWNAPWPVNGSWREPY